MSPIFVCGLVVSLFPTVSLPNEAAVVVHNGQPRAVVLLPAKADATTRAAADLLVHYVQHATGAKLPLIEEPASAERVEGVRIFVGPRETACRLDLAEKSLDADGFVIHVPDTRHIVIVGGTSTGAEFGVTEFLERFVGVRWLLPGDHGDDVPATKTIVVPVGTIRQEPAFFSRAFSGLQGAAQLEWARRNRMNPRVAFHHHLNKLFTPERYGSRHPEFFPWRNGQRYVPASQNEHGWQPCFSAPGLAEEAIVSIARYFQEHPDVPSYSLGTNDSSGFCQCDECLRQAGPRKNFLGRQNHSAAYFRFANRVVEGVLKRHPDKVFGCLAYSEVAEAPQQIKLHPRLIPYMTYDRMKWANLELRHEGEEMTRRWQAASPTLGWYDYIYGAPFCVPRVWFHRMAEYYRFGHAHGVRAMYAEAYPNWGEGPKLYVSLKLQWDPTRDVDQLLREWYARCVGEEGASDLAAYYAHWEDFWTRRILTSKWFSKGGQYLSFSHPGYLADVTGDDLVRSRRWLETAGQKAKTPAQRSRAALLLRAFEYYEATALACSARRIAERLTISNATEALSALEEGVRFFAAGQKRLQLVKEFARHPVLRHPLELERFPLLRGDNWGAELLWPVFDQAAREDGSVRARLRALAASSDNSLSRQAQTMLALMSPLARPPVTLNPAFQTEGLRWPKGWTPWVRDRGGRLAMASAAGRDDQPGVLARGMARGGPYQDFEVTPGRYGAVALFRVPTPVKTGATVTISLAPLTEKRQTLPASQTTVPATAGEWRRIATTIELRAAKADDPVRKLRVCVILDGFGPDDEAHIAEAAAVRLEK